MTSEDSAIQALQQREATGPVTVDSLVSDLTSLGVRPGMVLLVHTSLSALGWVCGGAQAVVLALEQALGHEGTLVMPAHSGGLSEPSYWRAPPVPESWFEVIRSTMPPFDAAMTPTRRMGVVAECFRTQPGTVRSSHPQSSFAARGPHASRVVDGHSLSYSMGEGSPLARVYELDGRVLLLGVSHANNTSLHLGEFRADPPGRRPVEQGAPVVADGVRRWIRFQDLDWDSDDFEELGRAFAQETGLEQQGAAGAGRALLMSQRAVVDFASRWISAHRATGR